MEKMGARSHCNLVNLRGVNGVVRAVLFNVHVYFQVFSMSFPQTALNSSC